MSKPMVVTLPFVMLLLDYWPLGRLGWMGERGFWGRLGWLVVEKLPFFGLTAGACVITVWAQSTGGAISEIPWNIRTANALLSYVGYLQKTVWPAGLAVFYPYPTEFPVWKVLGAGLVLAVVTGLVVWQGRRRGYWAVGWFW
ncbi:MAG: hypothetical protein N3I86_16640, partial [Verrucomicrobiae bacterium]|nr:hypothetical protein [Verrucomicrobiae bacterium]